MAQLHFFSSESVTEGHPDKMADQISDAVLDEYIRQDPTSRVACETLLTTGLVLVSGEITSQGRVNVPDLVRDTIKDIGYTDAAFGFDYKTCSVITTLNRQSPDISQGVTEGEGLHKEQGAGDQGMMFGYACRETADLMPMSIYYAHKLTQELSKARREERLKFLRPDGKSQVTVSYVDGKPSKIETVVVSTQHSADVAYPELKEAITEEVIKKSIPADLFSKNVVFHINPTGRFVVGGPQGDTGLTGRKIIADTYGGHGSHGGGAFSGKDPTKVDRSAAYMARYIAKNLVASGYVERCLVQLAYAIGIADPVSVMVEDYGTGRVSKEKLESVIRKIFPLKPKGIIETLNLRRPIYKKSASFGHFGRNEPEFTWERLDKVDSIKELLK